MTVHGRKLTSLLRVEERLFEANYFTRLMRRKRRSEEFGYCLNAFVSAARSVTFLMQKEMSRVPGFDLWWTEQQQLLGRDRAARFFLKLRNFSQKEGRISLVGASVGGQRGRASYRFAGTADRVPPELLQRDVVECCVEHIVKLARLVLACTQRFPFHTCPRRAITPEGLEALQLTTVELGAVIGFDSGWIEAGARIPLEHQLRLLREYVDGLDFEALERLSRRRTKGVVRVADASADLSERRLTSLVAQMEGDYGRTNLPGLVGEMILLSKVAVEHDLGPDSPAGSGPSVS
jgi:hypothetical protein